MSDASDTGPEFLAPLAKPKKPAYVWFLQVVGAVGMLGLVAAILLPEVRRARPAAHRSQCKNNLKQIGLALEIYHETYGALPPAYTVDADGQPLHSWRTLILPFMDQGPLYESIDLSKPWNHPANVKAYETRVMTYQCPSGGMEKNATTYLAVVGRDCCFDPTKCRKFSEVWDGRYHTVAVIEVTPERAVHWMSPLDASQDMAMQPGTRKSHAEGGHVLLLDGSVRYISADLPVETLRGLLTIAGGEVIGDF